jgi:hypothetical protein
MERARPKLWLPQFEVQSRKRRYFSIARGSVMECGALFDLCNALGNLSPDEYRAGKLLRTRIGAMLSKLCLLGRVTTLFRVRSTFTCTSMFTSGNTNFTYSIPRRASLYFYLFVCVIRPRALATLPLPTVGSVPKVFAMKNRRGNGRDPPTRSRQSFDEPDTFPRNL